MSSIDNFMSVWFPQLNTDCQGQILKNVSFCSKIKFNKGDVIKISENNSGIIVITSDKPEWKGKYTKDWNYDCITEFNCCGCRKGIVSIKTITQESLFKTSLLKKELSFIKNCKICHKQMCPTCYNLEEGIYRGYCNDCIWMELG